LLFIICGLSLMGLKFMVDPPEVDINPDIYYNPNNVLLSYD